MQDTCLLPRFQKVGNLAEPHWELLRARAGYEYDIGLRLAWRPVLALQ